ncbi:HVA22-like protein j [Linum grandiflorum]
MLGDFLNRLLLLFFGYAYPAFECFKVAEKNKINIEDIRFWCQYWIIVALITVCERIVDMFLWWLPFYGEAKLGFFIWLWYPKTKGTCFVFNNFVRPYVSKHETDIDQKLHEVKARVWDFAIYYWQNCAKLGQSTFFQVLEQLATQSGRFGNNNVSKPQKKTGSTVPVAPPPPESPTAKRSGSGRWTPRATSRLNRQSSGVDSPRFQGPMDGDNDELNQAKLRLRRAVA